MSQMKRMIEVIDKYNRLPNGNFKEEIREEMDKIKELIHYDDYKSEKDQINKMNSMITCIGYRGEE